MNRHLRMLVVDDVATMRALVCSLLKEIGYTEFEEAVDGRDALAKLRGGGFDFVVSDINMPNMNGIELLRALRADERLSRLPLLLVTAEARKDEIILAARSGASGFIVKPFTRATLESKLQAILERVETA